MTFDELYNLVIPNTKGILSMVDEYTLYCYYTGINPLVPGTRYNSPYRIDKFASFAIYESNYGDPKKGVVTDYMWMDHGVGESGNIFKLIGKITGLVTKDEIISRINTDFALGLNTSSSTRSAEKIVRYERPEQPVIKISIINQPLTTKGVEFWQQFGIDQVLLDFYNTTQVQYYWLHDDQPAPKVAMDPMFAYRVGRYYQLYSPYADKQYKFRNDFPREYFFGYLQLPQQGDRLIIDKSSKDVIFCRRLGLYAVNGKSETTSIPHDKIMELKSRFRDIYLMLDNDVAGIKMMQRYMKEYPWMKPRLLEGAKDKTDLCKAVGINEAERRIKHIISQ